MSKQEKKLSGKTKKIKLRVLENNQLVYRLVEVPVEDPRPEFNPENSPSAPAVAQEGKLGSSSSDKTVESVGL